MRILIVGEYSGFAANLSSGFRKLGCEVLILGNLDGWKKIDSGEGTILYPVKNVRIGNQILRRTWIFSGLHSYFKNYRYDIKKFDSYFDIAIIVNYEFVRLNYEYWYPKISYDDLRKVLKKKDEIYLIACGNDMPYLKNISRLRYSPYVTVSKNRFFKPRLMNIFNRTLQNIKGVIPVMYDYATAYRNIQKEYSIKVYPTIPLPVNTDGFSFNNEISNKIVIYHGKVREEKGGKFIIPALVKLQSLYPNRVEVVLHDKMPFQEYLAELPKANVVVDQCYGYSYGMNAIYAMAMGKIVLSGNESECELEFGRKVPIINILPDSDDIFRKLENLINLPAAMLNKLSIDSYNFVSTFHSDVIVAKRYFDIFSNANL